MKTHFHLVVETPRANLVPGMKWLLSTYAIRFNRGHKVFGYLFGGRYEALPVVGSGSGYLRTACDYVHLNPVPAKLLKPEQKLAEFGWRSYLDYVKEPKGRPKSLPVGRVLGECGIPKTVRPGGGSLSKEWNAVGPAIGPNSRRSSEIGMWGELLAPMKARRGPEHFGAAVRESEMAKAERVVQRELKRLGWREEEINRPTEGGPGESAPGDALTAEHHHDHRVDRGAVTDGDARSFIASVVLGRQNEATTEKKKSEINNANVRPLR